MHTLSVVGVREEAPDVVTVLLALPEGFKYLPGQFVVLQLTVDGKPLRRSYSLASAPHQDTLDITVKRQENGRFSPALCDVSIGDEVGMLGPFGQFLLPSERRPIVLHASGTGITPFMSFLRHLSVVGDTREILLVYSNRRPQDILYREELSQLARALRLRIELTITRADGIEWEGLTGRINRELLGSIDMPPDALHYLCGSTPMVAGVKEELLSMGVEKERVLTEKFGNIEA